MPSKLSRKELTQCADCACFNIRKASRAVTAVYEERLHETGLRGTQFTLLVMIAANEPITISHLAEKLVMDRTTLTRNLRPLEKQELVDVVQGEDRRTRAVRLSKLGHKSLAEALPLWKKAQKKVVRFMGEEQMTDLLHTLEKITGI